MNKPKCLISNKMKPTNGCTVNIQKKIHFFALCRSKCFIFYKKINSIFFL